MSAASAGNSLYAEGLSPLSAGQRRLIFATSARIGLRDEQLHDLVESGSDYRTRAITALTMTEARRLIGTLKRLENGSRRSPKGSAKLFTASSDGSREEIRRHSQKELMAMNDDEIRTNLQAMFKVGFPRSLPRALHSGDDQILEGREQIIIGGGARQACSVCELVIEQTDRERIEYRYADRTVRFHGRCRQLWDEERRKPIRR